MNLTVDGERQGTVCCGGSDDEESGATWSGLLVKDGYKGMNLFGICDGKDGLLMSRNVIQHTSLKRL